MGTLANILWFIVAVIVVLWLLGFLFRVGGDLIHLLLLIAGVILVYNLLTNRRTA
jgi:hypothetical protein